MNEIYYEDCRISKIKMVNNLFPNKEKQIWI